MRTPALWEVYFVRSCRFTRPPKDKYVVVVGLLGEEVLCMFINSEERPFIQGKPHLKPCEVPIGVTGHPFLHHDSFLSATEAHGYGPHELTDRRGCLDDDARTRTATAIRVCKKLTFGLKEAILPGLPPRPSAP